jgi:feruloyl esterase
MTGLGKTISRLSHFMRRRPLPSMADLQPSRLKLTEAFGSNPGALAMWSYVSAHRASPSPLVVVLHGCTQSAAVYDYCSGWSALAEDSGFAVLYPEQSPRNNPKRCFNWFEPADIQRNSGEVLSIRQMIERLVIDAGIDRRRIFITGLSAGGAMAAAMLATYPETFAGGAIIAGLPYRTAGTVRQAFDAMFKGHQRSGQQWGDAVRAASHHRGPWPQISVWHGMADRTVLSMNADELVEQWLNVHGLSGAPETVETQGRMKRHFWHALDGTPVVEKCLISGMGHGAPVDARQGIPGKGNAGPFMLDVGISSTWHCAFSWGLAQPSARRFSSPEQAREEAMGIASSAIGTVIARAFRAAGIVK